MKIEKKPSTLLYPCPVVLVTCIDSDGRPNIITLAWVGIACSEPPVLSLAIRPSRYSYNLIGECKEFVVNIPTENMVNICDYLGFISGREFDKFNEAKLTSEPAKKVKPPLIKECPINLECTLRHKIELGAHALFLGEVIAAHVDKDVVDNSGNIDFRKAKPFTYNQGEYWSLRKKIGFYGQYKKGLR